MTADTDLPTRILDLSPQLGEYAAYYGSYISLVPTGPILPVMSTELDRTMAVLGSIDEPASLRRHKPYTWSTRQVVGHMCDCERVFAFRALHIARGDPAALAGFDENAYVNIAAFDRIALRELAADFATARRCTLSMLRSFEDAAWLRIGTANGTPVSVRALASIMIGHERHHTSILRRRHGLE